MYVTVHVPDSDIRELKASIDSGDEYVGQAFDDLALSVGTEAIESALLELENE